MPLSAPADVDGEVEHLASVNLVEKGLGVVETAAVAGEDLHLLVLAELLPHLRLHLKHRSVRSHEERVLLPADGADLDLLDLHRVPLVVGHTLADEGGVPDGEPAEVVLPSVKGTDR
jgi:hypothetical protein